MAALLDAWDWEVPTRIGVEKPVYLRIFSQWPELDDSEEDVMLSINGALNEIGHAQYKAPPDLQRQSVLEVMQRWIEIRREEKNQSF